jgi:hypothetical protein
MIDDYDSRQDASNEKRRKALVEEENHRIILQRVFGSDDGAYVLRWLLDLCGYWASSFPTERAFGKFELGRTVFNQLCLVDLSIINALLDRRRQQAEAVRIEERKRIESKRL